MCQATVYLDDRVIAQEVVGLEPIGGVVRLTTFFDEPRVVAGRIRHIDFLTHRVLLEPLERRADERD